MSSVQQFPAAMMEDPAFVSGSEGINSDASLVSDLFDGDLTAEELNGKNPFHPRFSMAGHRACYT